MEPIRILHVVGRMDRGGIETFLMNVYRKIDREQIQFDFLAHYGKENADYNEEIRSMGGRIYEMPAIKTPEGARYHMFFKYRKALNEFFAEHQEYNVIHGHMTNTAAIYMPIARKHGVEYRIAHSHQGKAMNGLAGFVTDLMSAPIPKLSTHWFACSEAAAQWIFSQKSIDEGKVTMVKNGIDTARFAYSPQVRREVREELGVGDSFLIGHVGNFHYPKNQAFLLEVMKEMLVQRPDTRLCLVGFGIDREPVMQKAQEMGLGDRVLFPGVRKDINRLMQAFDLFVLPSFFEGLPLVSVEAQTAGLPCLFSDAVSAEADITGNVTYLPLSAGAKGWAQQINAVADSFVRRDMRDKVIAEGYDIQTTTSFLQDFYLIHGRRGN